MPLMPAHPRLLLSLVLTLLSAGVWLHAASLPEARIVLAKHSFSVEIAATEASRERGLMYRTHLPAAHGMLFVYSHAQPRFFWMKNTLIPLDIIFFDARKQLINISSDTPPCKADPCPTYASDAPAEYVLELNAGLAGKLGLKAGDRFRLY